MRRANPLNQCEAETGKGTRCMHYGKHALTFHYGLGRAENVRLCGTHIKGLSSGILRLATGERLRRTATKVRP